MEQMIYRELNLKEDYKPLSEIWRKSPIGMVPIIEMLSPYGITVLNDNGKVVGAVFNFYIKDTTMVLIGYPILSDYVDKYRGTVVDCMFHYAEELSSKKGYHLAQTYSNLEHVQERLINNHWIVGDTNVTHLVKKV